MPSSRPAAAYLVDLLLAVLVISVIAGALIPGARAVIQSSCRRVAACPTSSPTRPTELAELNTLTVASAGSLAGYDRACGNGHRCVFGSAWTDDVDVTDGHNGCSTRIDVLRRDAEAGSVRGHGCVVTGGVWLSPYSGQAITTVEDVQIDHIVPLADAWRSGAASWTRRQRTNFANDPLELLAVDAQSNRAKGDRGPDSWLPAHHRCRYAQRWVEVKHRYRLTVTRAEKHALTAVLAGCQNPTR